MDNNYHIVTDNGSFPIPYGYQGQLQDQEDPSQNANPHQEYIQTNLTQAESPGGYPQVHQVVQQSHHATKHQRMIQLKSQIDSYKSFYIVMWFFLIIDIPCLVLAAIEFLRLLTNHHCTHGGNPWNNCKDRDLMKVSSSIALVLLPICIFFAYWGIRAFKRKNGAIFAWLKWCYLGLTCLYIGEFFAYHPLLFVHILILIYLTFCCFRLEKLCKEMQLVESSLAHSVQQNQAV